MVQIIVNNTVEIKGLTPEMVAEAFWDLRPNEQARFYNHIGHLADDQLPSLLEGIITDQQLTHKGREVMATIGEYAHYTGYCK